MRYPRECFSINEDVTKAARAEYEKKVDLWYTKALEMYPNYFDMNFKDRINITHNISDSVGFSIW